MSHTGGQILTFNKAILEIILGINWYHQRVKWSKLHWIPKNGILTVKKNYGGRNTSSRKTVNFRKKWTVFCQWSKFDLNLGLSTVFHLAFWVHLFMPFRSNTTRKQSYWIMLQRHMLYFPISKRHASNCRPSPNWSRVIWYRKRQWLISFDDLNYLFVFWRRILFENLFNFFSIVLFRILTSFLKTGRFVSNCSTCSICSRKRMGKPV